MLGPLLVTGGRKAHLRSRARRGGPPGWRQKKSEEMILINTLASHGVNITRKVGESRSDREVPEGYPARTLSPYPALGEGSRHAQTCSNRANAQAPATQR